MLRRLLLTVAAVVVPLAALLVPSAADAATTATCTSGVAVSQFAFNPPSVPAGSGSALTLVLQNCTGQAIQGSTDWFGQYVGQGCPVLDPIPFSYTLAPGGSYTLTNRYGDPGFSGCAPTALKISANVNVNGAGTVTTVTAALTFAQQAAGCQVTYAPAANLSYNATIPPGASQSFGVQGTWTTNDASPTSFAVNGVTCT